MASYTAPLSCVALPHNTPLSSPELGQVIPAMYGRSPVLPLYQWWIAPWQLPQEHAKARCGFTSTHLCFYLYMVDGDVISYATANDQKMCVSLRASHKNAHLSQCRHRASVRH